MPNNRVLVCWTNWGPYHFARLRRLTEMSPAGWQVGGLQLFGSGGIYDWGENRSEPPNFVSLALSGDPTRNPTIRDAQRITRYLRQFRPSHVFVSSYRWMSLLILFLARLFGAKVIMMNDTLPTTARPGRLRVVFRRYAVRLFDGALVAGTPHLRYYEKLGVALNRMASGLDVVDDEFFCRHAAVIKTAQSLDDATRRPYLLTIGRFESRKRVDMLIAAYAVVRDDFPDLELVIAGYGPELGALVQQSIDLGLRTTLHGRLLRDGVGSVTFLPRVEPDEAAGLYALARLFVLCSAWEPWGLVVNEALACGTPVVCSDSVGCAEDLVAGFDDSYTFVAEDLASLVETLREAVPAAANVRAATPRPLNQLSRFAESAIHLSRH